MRSNLATFPSYFECAGKSEAAAAFELAKNAVCCRFIAGKGAPKYYGRLLMASASMTTSKVPELSLKFPSFTPRNSTPSRCATKSLLRPIKMKSSLSSPITAINAPVSCVLISLSGSGILGRPSGEETRLAPRLTRPEAVMRSRCPRRTTKPLLVQPLLVLSARTLMFTWKKVGGAFGFVVLEDVLPVSLLDGWVLDGGWYEGDCVLELSLPALPTASNSIQSTSSIYTVIRLFRPRDPLPTSIVNCSLRKPMIWPRITLPSLR